MLKKYLLYIAFFSSLFLLISCEKDVDGFYSYLLKVTDGEKEYLINVRQYKEDAIFCRRDDWTDEKKGPLSYIIKKENEQNTAGYFIIHDEKKTFEIKPAKDYNFLVEENWPGELKLKLMKEEVQGEEEIHGYMCKKIKYTDEERGDICILWFSPEFPCPLKIKSEISDFIFTMEVTEIKEETQDREIFSIPANYEIIRITTEEVENY